MVEFLSHRGIFPDDLHPFLVNVIPVEHLAQVQP